MRVFVWILALSWIYFLYELIFGGGVSKFIVVTALILSFLSLANIAEKYKLIKKKDKVTDALNEIGEVTAASSLKIGNAMMHAGEIVKPIKKTE